jgi:peptidoglycan/LPS O-acetylase OafA/YrhL
MVTPIVRATGLLDPLPDPVEWYLRPSPGHTNFVMFPWAGFVFAGALLGTLIQRVREPLAERRLHVWMAAAGVAVALAGYGAAFLPSLYAQSSFWTSSPTFFFLRTGLLVFALAVAWLWEQRPTGARWSPLQHFGRTSLFVYWVHVEMAYGWFSAPLHRQLPFGQALVAFALFTVFLFGLSLAWARVRGRLRRDRVPLLRSG